MLKVKIISESNAPSLERAINEFLTNKFIASVIDIKFTVNKKDYIDLYSSMIYYKCYVECDNI